MTELVGKLIKESKKVTLLDLQNTAELAILILTFLFCIYVVSPIV
jgi:hypothetical protein